MIDKVHDHILDELRTNTRTDTVFVLTSIFLNIIGLAVNAAIAAEGSGDVTLIVILIFVVLILVVNFVAEAGLIKGRQTRTKLISGLLSIYRDNGVDKYYDSSLLEAYKLRYNLFMIVVLATGVVAIAVPFIILAL